MGRPVAFYETKLKILKDKNTLAYCGAASGKKKGL
jgi:hypothetical protein